MSRFVQVEVTFQSEWTEIIEVEVPDDADGADIDILAEQAARDHDACSIEAELNAEMVAFCVLDDAGEPASDEGDASAPEGGAA